MSLPEIISGSTRPASMCGEKTSTGEVLMSPSPEATASARSAGVPLWMSFTSMPRRRTQDCMVAS